MSKKGAKFEAHLHMTDGVYQQSLVVKNRHYYSVQHIQSAALFARLSSRIEKSYNGLFDSNDFSDHGAYVIGAIFAATSFLEAAINEFFADTVDNPQAEVRVLDAKVKDLLAEMWKRGVPRTATYSISDKYQIALVLSQKAAFNPGEAPFQDVKLLTRLRNALIHFEPVWVTTSSSKDSEPVSITKFEKVLRGKFTLNPLIPASTDNPFFPDRCLGHGCAKWAVTSSLSLADEFFSRVGLPAPYDHIRNRLDTE